MALRANVQDRLIADKLGFRCSATDLVAGTSEHLTEIAEIAEILALGLMRVAERKSSQNSADAEDKPVDFEGVWSGRVASLDREIGT